MNITFDMQALQSVNSIGGIGNYNRNFLDSLFKLYPENKYQLIFNGLYDISYLEYSHPVKGHNRVVRYLKGNDMNPINKWMQWVAYQSKPSDLLHILSPFEPQTHTVISNNIPSKTIVTIYDFIPYIFKDLYLSSPLSMKLYCDRLKIVKSARLLLSISEATRRDAINIFNISPEKIVNIGIAPSAEFHKMDASETDSISNVKTKYGIDGFFVLTVSNLDHRKNLVPLLRAFSHLPEAILKEFTLIVVCNSDPEYVKKDKNVTELLNQTNGPKIKFVHFISTNDLVSLYNSCHLFVYASLYEGGGLPVMEAMKCGAPVVASNTSSIPEYVGRKDNLFDPTNQEEIMYAIVRVLTNENLRKELGNFGQEYSNNFSWDRVVGKTIQAYKSVLR